MRILRTTERYEAGWREQNFIPDNEAPRQVKFEKNQCLCGFEAFEYVKGRIKRRILA